MVVAKPSNATNERALSLRVSSRSLKGIQAAFDDKNLVTNAGLLVVSTLSQILELEEPIEAKVSLGKRLGGANPGAKIPTAFHGYDSRSQSYRTCRRAPPTPLRDPGQLGFHPSPLPLQEN